MSSYRCASSSTSDSLSRSSENQEVQGLGKTQSGQQGTWHTHTKHNMAGHGDGDNMNHYLEILGRTVTGLPEETDVLMRGVHARHEIIFWDHQKKLI